MEKKDLTGKQILITDDDYTCYLYIKSVLEITGANIHWANNGLNAIEFVKSNSNVDLIFMDLKMPVMGGQEATEHIQSINKDIPIIIQSCFAREFYTGNPKRHNVEFLEKPFKPGDVYDVINKIFDK